MDGLYIDKCDDLILLENQKKELCLISAFFQGLHFQDHNRESHILLEIVQAMNFVWEKRDDFKEMYSGSASVDIIAGWNSDLIKSVESGSSLKVGEFWNVEILEFYILESKIDCPIFYYREIPDEKKYVLVKTRANMTCPSKNSNCMVFVELANKHKMLVQQLPEERELHAHFQNTDFTLPILYDFSSTNYLASFSGHNFFLPVHLARLTLVTHFGACGYKCFSDILGSLVLFFHFSLFFFNIKYFLFSRFLMARYIEVSRRTMER